MPVQVDAADSMLVDDARRTASQEDYRAAGVRVGAHDSRIDVRCEDLGLDEHALRVVEAVLLRQVAKVLLEEGLVGPATRELLDVEV